MASGHGNSEWEVMMMQMCGTCSGMMLPDALDGGQVCCSCGRRTSPPPKPQRWPGKLPMMADAKTERLRRQTL